MTDTAASEDTLTDRLLGFFGVPFRGQTHRNLAYLLLAFPLGLAYFVGVTVGLSTGVALLITLVGAPLLLVTLYGVTLIAEFEASLARHLLGIDVPAPKSLRRDDGPRGLDFDSLLAWARRLVSAPTTWTALVLVGVKFVFGVTAFVVVTTTTMLSLVLLAAPVAILTDLPLQVNSLTEGVTVGVVGNGEPLWLADTLPEATGLALLGVLVTLLSLHLVNGLAKFGGIYTAALLDVDGSDETTA